MVMAALTSCPPSRKPATPPAAPAAKALRAETLLKIPQQLTGFGRVVLLRESFGNQEQAPVAHEPIRIPLQHLMNRLGDRRIRHRQRRTHRLIQRLFHRGSRTSAGTHTAQPAADSS